MIQAMQILQLPALDLEARIEQELTENPFLEVAEDQPAEGEGEESQASDSPAGEDADAARNGELSDPASEAAAEARQEADGLDNMLEVLERYERDFGDGRLRGAGGGEETDRKYEALQNAPCVPKSLPETLLDQVAFLDLDEDDRALYQYLVWSLDDHGYLTSSREELCAELSRELVRPVASEELERAIRRLRAATHPAMAAQDLREGLLLQLDELDGDASLVRTMVSDHLEDIQANRLPRIAKVTGRSLADVKLAIESIRTLDPSPGAEFGQALATTIHPDVTVEELDGEYVVRLSHERVRELTISPAYRKLLQQAQRGDGVRDWVKRRLESARWFIDALQQRQSTLHRISEAIFRHQRGFLERGIAGLRPLRMQEIADDVGVHISTVSRGVSGKYVQTARGIHPLKFFFTGGTTTSSGEVASQTSIKQLIQELVAQENRAKPLSDDQLAALLEETDGIRIARRTVTKYRKALEIPSSSQRRAY